MKNVDVKTDKEIMTITIDCTKNFGKSKTGKSNIVASSEGFQTFATVSGKQVALNLNVSTK